MTLETRVNNEQDSYDGEPRLFPTSQEFSFFHALIQNPTEKLRMAIVELFTQKPQAPENPEITVVPSEKVEAGKFEAWVENSQ